MKVSPECKRDHPDCFACSGGRCGILSSTDFPEGKDCPFFKTRKQCTEENKARRQRLDSLGLNYLFDKYGG